MDVALSGFHFAEIKFLFEADRPHTGQGMDR